MPMISTLPLSRRALIGAAAALPFAARAQAAWKPSRPVTLIVPFAAGSGTDSVSRLLATLLEQEWGSQVVVDNRPGANGAIAAVATARAAPDGHTVMITTNSPHGATPALMKRPTYDAINDFTPIGRMGTYIFVLAVNDQVPARNLQEFLALARSQPGKLTYASGNTTGVVGGAMLGLGRALGETVAVYTVLNLVYDIRIEVLLSAGGNVASMIVNKFGEADQVELQALMAAGFVLFLVTLAVNFLANFIINKTARE